MIVFPAFARRYGSKRSVSGLSILTAALFLEIRPTRWPVPNLQPTGLLNRARLRRPVNRRLRFTDTLSHCHIDAFNAHLIIIPRSTLMIGQPRNSTTRKNQYQKGDAQNQSKFYSNDFVYYNYKLSDGGKKRGVSINKSRICRGNSDCQILLHMNEIVIKGRHRVLVWCHHHAIWRARKHRSIDLQVGAGFSGYLSIEFFFDPTNGIKKFMKYNCGQPTLMITYPLIIDRFAVDNYFSTW